MGFREMAQRELEYQKKLRANINKRKKPEVPGGLYCKTRTNGEKQFYVRMKGTGKYVYINRGQLSLMAELVRERFDEERKDILEENIASLEDLLSRYREPDAESVLDGMPLVYREARVHLSKYAEGNGKEEPTGEVVADDGKHVTTFGLVTKSKGEAWIAETLHAAGIPFQYEKKLVLLDESGRRVTLHPDFTIPVGRGKSIYWEHKGMLLDEDYAEMDNRKMALYYRNGIYPPIGLIVTCDGPDGSLDMSDVNQIIQGILLPMVKPSGKKS